MEGTVADRNIPELLNTDKVSHHDGSAVCFFTLDDTILEFLEAAMVFLKMYG